jgi:hypothetical protein
VGIKITIGVDLLQTAVIAPGGVHLEFTNGDTAIEFLYALKQAIYESANVKPAVNPYHALPPSKNPYVDVPLPVVGMDVCDIVSSWLRPTDGRNVPANVEMRPMTDDAVPLVDDERTVETWRDRAPLL